MLITLRIKVSKVNCNNLYYNIIHSGQLCQASQYIHTPKFGVGGRRC